MTKIYLIRHAEAEGNTFRRAHGHYNGLVTVKGHKQIELLRERMADVDIDAVYSSDLTRAVTTALAVSEPRGLNIITTQDLREIDMGAWEDRTWGDIEYFDYDMNILFNCDPARWDVEGGEPYDSVCSRVYDCIAGIASQHDGQSVAVFSHGFAIRAFLCRVRGIASEEIQQVPYCDNTAVTLLTFDNGCFSIEFAGDNSHLTGGSSTLESQSWWRAKDRQKPENLRYQPLGEVVPELLYRIFKVKAGERANADTEYAAFLVDEPVGILGLDTVRDAGDNIGWINYIHVSEQHRRSTFGTQLIGLAVSDFRKLRRERLRIELPTDKSGIAFFDKCGFQLLYTAGGVSVMEKVIKNW